MSNELKRVGLVFTQEGAVDFKKTLQDINIEMNKNYNQFKLTQAQWDSSTKSTEKLRAEQEYLKNAYEIQADKVNTLKMQLSDLENAEDKNTTAIKKKRNELTNAEIKLETYNKRLKEVDSQLNNTGKKIQEFGTKIQDAGKKIEGAGKKLSAFSGAVAGAFVASAKGAIDFETAFTGVEKTVDGTAEQMAELKRGIRDMAKQIPSTTTEISAVAEAAGQLGIKTENILSFSKAMIDLGNSTNLTADQAASQLAKFANIMQMSQKDFNKLGSSIVDLGNHFATTEADIVSMSMRLAGAGKQVGLSEGQVLGFATALSSVGIEAEMGGSAMSKAMIKMQNAAEMGGEKLNTILKKTGKSLRELELMSANDSMGFKELSQSIGMTSTELKQFITSGKNLKDFAKVSGMTAKQFEKAWKKDAAGALSAFIKGLGNAENKGESAIAMLTEMGLTEVRLRDSLLRAANAGNLFNEAIETGTRAWEDNTALTNEANKRYETLQSKIQIAINKLKDIGITIGEKLMPSIEKIIDKFGQWADKFSQLSDEEVDMIVNLGLIVAAAGPVITIIGKLTSVIGGVTQGIGTVVQAIGVMNGTITSTSSVVNGLAGVFSAVTSPIGLACVGIVAAIGTIAIAANVTMEKTVGSFKEITKSIEEQKDTMQKLQESREKLLDADSNQIIITQELAAELDKIVDKNGKIKQGYEKRAKYILNELNKSLGTEYKLNGNIIGQYSTMRSEIDKLIAKKKLESVINAYQAEYGEALKKESEATENLVKLRQELTEATAQLTKAENYGDRQEIQMKISALGKNIKEQTELISQYGFTIKNYEDLQTASLSNSTQEMEKAVEKMGTSWNKAKEQAEKSIEEQINSQSKYIDNLKKAIQTAKDTNDEYQEYILNSQLETNKKQLKELGDNLAKQTLTVKELTPEQIEAWKNLSKQDLDVFIENLSLLSEETRNEISKATGVISSDTLMVDATKNKGIQITDGFVNCLELSQKTKNEIDETKAIINQDTSVQNATLNLGYRLNQAAEGSIELPKEMRNKIFETKDVVKKDTTVQNATADLAKRAEKSVRSNNSSIWGADMVVGLGNGIKSKLSWITGIVSNLASTISSYLHFSKPDVGPLREYEKWMPDMVEGLGQSLDKASPRLVDKVKDMSEEMADELKKVDEISSTGDNTKQLTKTSKTNNIKYELQMNIYPQKLDEKELDNLFNYINRRFGTEY